MKVAWKLVSALFLLASLNAAEPALSEAKNLRSWLRVNSAKDLALSIFKAMRDSSLRSGPSGPGLRSE